MPTNITGNKGEWSEIYVLLRLLAEGKIHAADENLERIEEMYFPILKIIREELQNNKYEYVSGNKVKIFLNDDLVSELDKTAFSGEADFLYDILSKTKGSSFTVEQTETFMNSIGCTRLKAPSSDKTDITMQIHDIHTGYAPVCGFSIKSEIGNAPTLINASGATNCIFEVHGLSDNQIDSINAIDTGSKIKDRMERIFAEANNVNIVGFANSTFERNLMLIDSRMSELIAHALVYHYHGNINSCLDVVNTLEENNPMNFPGSGFYLFKFKKFLCSAALGMVPGAEWNGIDEANGGYIIVTTGGDVLAYHIYNRDFFESYLLNNTRFERGSTSRHNFASLYRGNGKVFLNLNLQIRFTR